MNIEVTPRRTVGITGFDVGSPAKGIGDCVGGYDEYGDACTDFTPITSNPANTAAALQYLYTPPVSQPAPSAGINWTQLFAPLTQAAGAIGSGYAASMLKPGQSLATQGTVVTGAGTTLPGSSMLGASTSSIMPILLLAGAGILLFSMTRR